MTPRRRGAYAPLSSTYAADDAVMEAGEAAELLFVRGLAFCSSSDSDGFITRAQLVRWVGAGMLDAEDRAKRLVEVGLWAEESGGFQIRSWLEWNDSSEDKGRRKRQDRERKAAERGAAHSYETGSVRPDDDPDPNPSTPPDDAGESGTVSERSPNGQVAGHVHGVRAESERTGRGSPAESPCLDTEHGSTEQNRNRTEQGQPRGQRRAGRPREPDRFDEFWLAYPRKEDKGHARTAWEKLTKHVAFDQETVIAAAAAFGERVRRTNVVRKYIPLPTTWLHGERWTDEVTEPAADVPEWYA